MSKKVTRIKKTQIEVPSSLTQADILLGKIGNTQNEINEIEKELKEKIADLKAAATKKLDPLVTRRSNQINSLFAFANSRKDELTQKVRSVVLSQGTFGWRMTTPRVEMKKSDEQMIAFLKKIGRDDYIRVIEEIDRQALLADRPKIAGISYLQNDEFFVIPKQKAKRPKTLTQAIDRETE